MNRQSYIWCPVRKRVVLKSTAAKRPHGVTVIKDIEPYESIASGKVIGGRVQKREDLKRTGCVEYEPSIKNYPRDDGIQKTLDRAFERFRG